jgi:hypothetical protein
MQINSIEIQSSTVIASTTIHSIPFINLDTSTVTIQQNRVVLEQKMENNNKVSIQNDPNTTYLIYQPKQTI